MKILIHSQTLTVQPFHPAIIMDVITFFMLGVKRIHECDFIAAQFCVNERLFITRWRHQMETFPHYWSSMRGIHKSRVNSPLKASDAELWYFFDVRLNKRLSKQSWGWCLETPSRSLWRHWNDELHIDINIVYRLFCFRKYMKSGVRSLLY